MSFMDAREHGVKAGTGFVSEAQANLDRKERTSTLETRLSFSQIGRAHV